MYTDPHMKRDLRLDNNTVLADDQLNHGTQTLGLARLCD